MTLQFISAKVYPLKTCSLSLLFVTRDADFVLVLCYFFIYISPFLCPPFISLSQLSFAMLDDGACDLLVITLSDVLWGRKKIVCIAYHMKQVDLDLCVLLSFFSFFFLLLFGTIWME